MFSVCRDTMNRKARAGWCGIVVIVMLGAIWLLAGLLALVWYFGLLPQFLPIVTFFVSSPKTKAELYGTYVLDCDLLKEELILRPDGTFTQTATIKATSEKISSKGTWVYRTGESKGLLCGSVVVDGYVSLLEEPWQRKLKRDYAHTQPDTGGWFADYWYGQLRLGDINSRPYFRKISDTY